MRIEKSSTAAPGADRYSCSSTITVLVQSRSPCICAGRVVCAKTEAMSNRAPKLSLVLAFLAVCLIWGSTFFAILVGLETIPPFFLAGARFIIAGGVLYTFARLRGTPAPTRTEWKNAALIGVLLCSVGNGLVTFS